MPEHLSKNILLVVSDTSVYKEQGKLYGFEPVVRELESLTTIFDEIIWLGSKISVKDTALRIPATDKIKIVQMPSVRHKSLNGIRVLLAYPVFLYYILKYVKIATHIHTRGPSHPALLCILLGYFMPYKKMWHKYAGNWIAEDVAFTYRLQKSRLKSIRSKNHKVTVNGYWPDNPGHILAFENPCFYSAELDHANHIARNKKFDDGFNLLFVGGLVKNKGILELLSAAERSLLPESIKEIFIVGDGQLYNEVLQRSASIHIPKITVLGHLNRKEVNEYYEKAHIIVLPSKTEGFPKVIAEGASYGCIPVVTDVSSIGQYIIDGETGYLLPDNSSESIAGALAKLVAADNLQNISFNATVMAKKFTYEHFRERIITEVFV